MDTKLINHIKHLKSRNMKFKVIGFYMTLLIIADDKGIINIGNIELLKVCDNISATELKRLRDQLIKNNLIEYNRGNNRVNSRYEMKYLKYKSVIDSNDNVEEKEWQPLEELKATVEEKNLLKEKEIEETEIPEEYL